MDLNIQHKIIKGIAALAKTKDEALFAEWMVMLSQCIEKNIQRIAFYERLALFPEFVKAVEPYTGLTMDDIIPFCHRSDVVPTTPEGIVSLDRNIRHLLCPCRHLKDTSQRHQIEETGGFNSKKERELSRLHKIISDQEQVIRVLRNQVAKGTLWGRYEEQESTPLNKGRNRK